jgi:hypothetical protein
MDNMAIQTARLPNAYHPYPAHVPTMTIMVTHRGQEYPVTIPAVSTLYDLSQRVAGPPLSVPVANQKFIIAPGPGFIRPPTAPTRRGDPNHVPLAPLVPGDPDTESDEEARRNPSRPETQQRKITLLGATAQQVADLTADIARARGPHQSAAGARGRGPRRGGGDGDRRAGRLLGAMGQSRAAEAQQRRLGGVAGVGGGEDYGFGGVRVMAGFGDAERARGLLEALRGDRGIREAMRRWRFRVGQLVEMDPAENTTATARTLGLNRNRGEVIELRLRTDRYDGFRHYGGIRKTLCHELAHNVWSEHDANFWTLCREIEAFVQQQSWNVGRRVGGDDVEFYEPPDDEDEHVDGGGWIGGVRAVGGAAPLTGMTRGEAMARAAEERMRSSGPGLLDEVRAAMDRRESERTTEEMRAAEREAEEREAEANGDGAAQ